MADPERKFSPRMAAFLAAYSECGHICRSAEAAGISRDLHYRAMRNNPAYREAFAKSEAEYGDVIEGHARVLAQQGVEEPVFQGGVEVGKKTRYPQAIIIRLLEAAKPDKYKRNFQVEHTGSVAIVERLLAGRKRAAAAKEET